MVDPIPWAQLSPNERDAMVAEHIFGRKIIAWKDGRVLLMAREGAVGHESIPPYTTSMDAVWLIADTFDEIIVSKHIPDKYHCELYRSMIRYIGVADTPQEAICRAAFKAHKIEVEA